jgi:hypothetical protein
MKDALIFLTTIGLVIFVVSYYILLLLRMNDKVKSLMIENNTLKHDIPSRIVDTYRIKVREDYLRTTIECGITNKGIKIIFEDTSGKFGDEMLDGYELTPQELLNILQKHDESSFSGYCSKETLEGKRCKDICDKAHCGY